MKRVVVFGNAGGGKSTLARRLAEITRLPLYVLDLIEFRDGRYWRGEINGGKLSPEEFTKIHAKILSQNQWIIDGYGGAALAWERFASADTLVYVDLPIINHYWGVTKRLSSGLFSDPKGWPENCPIWESTLQSYRVVGLCDQHLTPKYRQYVADAALSKRVYHLKCRSAIAALIQAVIAEQRGATGKQ